ncbi:MAG: sulfur carrier protein ThiS [Pyrinomonadaceae bacterium]|jgi:sulfur carrier protein|nr:sulfur carrier protein ThiS [Vibrio parahaemolyticus]
MKVFVNGEEREFEKELSVAELIRRLGLLSIRVAVERNKSIVSRQNWESEIVSEGDRLEIVHFVGGG